MKELEIYLQTLLPFKEHELQTITILFQEKLFNKGQFLAKEGEYSNKVAFIKQGVLRAYVRTNKGEDYNKTFFTENTFVGAYSSLVTGNINLINIQCLTDSTLLVANYKEFTNLYNSIPLIERFSRIVAERFFVSKENREIQLVTLEAKERYELFKTEHLGLDQRIPQYHIASYLGVTPTQLSRIRATR